MNLPAVLYRTAPSVHPDPTWGDALARIKYCVRGLARPRLTAEWLALLASPRLQGLVQRHPHILSKLQRPYLHRRLNANERLAVLKRHYRFVEESLDDAVRSRIFSPRGCRLTVLPVEDTEQFTLRLFYSSQFEKEGDLTLALFDEQAGAPLFTLSFCASGYGAGEDREIFIGGLQGHTSAGQRELIVNLTRSLHGLRPKALLVFAVQELAQIWGFSRLLAVGDGEHIYRHFRKRKELHASYDEFWLECLGAKQPGGNFELPIAPPQRNLAELSRNKRPVYRRRYAMLDQMREEMREQLKPAWLPAAVPVLNEPLQFEEGAVLEVEEIAFEAL